MGASTPAAAPRPTRPLRLLPPRRKLKRGLGDKLQELAALWPAYLVELERLVDEALKFTPPSAPIA